MIQIFRITVLAAALALALVLVGAGAYLGGVLGTFLILAGVLGVPLGILGVLLLHWLQGAQAADGLSRVQTATVERVARNMRTELTDALTAAKRAALPPDEIARIMGTARAALAPHADLRDVKDGIEIKLAARVSGAGVADAQRALRGALAQAGARAAPILEARAAIFEKPGGSALDLPRDHLKATCDAYLARYHLATKDFDKKVAAIERAVAAASAELDSESAWEHIRSAKKFWAEGQPELALKELEFASTITIGYTRPEFDERRAALQRNLQRLRDLPLSAAASPAAAERVTRIERDAASLDVHGQGLAGLEAVEQSLATTLDDAREASMKRLAQVVQAIDRHPNLGELAQRRSLDEISRALDGLPTLRGNMTPTTLGSWIATMENVGERLARHSQLVDVLRWMPQMGERIKKTLDEKGTVGVADLPIRGAERDKGELILAVYAGLNRGVEFDGTTLRPAEPARNVPVDVGANTR